MLAEERRLRIRDILSTERTITAAELREMLGVTGATVRRDLAALEQEGILIRSHGGAISRTLSTSFQLSYEALLRTSREEKNAIARKAESLVLDGDTVFLEGSTTVYELACLLRPRNHLTVVTNSPPILGQLQHSSGITLMSTGGDLQLDTYYLSGVWAQRALSEIRVDKAFLGVSSLDPSYGVSAARQGEAEIKKLLVKAARVRIGLADHTKFGKQSFAYVGPISDLNFIVTDSDTPAEFIAEIEQIGVEVIIAQMRSAPSTQGAQVS